MLIDKEIPKELEVKEYKVTRPPRTKSKLLQKLREEEREAKQEAAYVTALELREKFTRPSDAKVEILTDYNLKYKEEKIEEMKHGSDDPEAFSKK